MIAAMIDANHISERLASLKLALRQQRLIQIKLELADMRKRCA